MIISDSSFPWGTGMKVRNKTLRMSKSSLNAKQAFSKCILGPNIGPKGQLLQELVSGALAEKLSLHTKECSVQQNFISHRFGNHLCSRVSV